MNMGTNMQAHRVGLRFRMDYCDTLSRLTVEEGVSPVTTRDIKEYLGSWSSWGTVRTIWWTWCIILSKLPRYWQWGGIMGMKKVQMSLHLVFPHQIIMIKVMILLVMRVVILLVIFQIQSLHPYILPHLIMIKVSVILLVVLHSSSFTSWSPTTTSYLWSSKSGPTTFSSTS